jgi:hypothetical protein
LIPKGLWWSGAVLAISSSNDVMRRGAHYIDLNCDNWVTA